MRAISLLLVSLFVVLPCAIHAVPPVPWGPMHKHVEIEYNVDQEGYSSNFKQFNYNFPGLAMRVDSTYLTGPSIDAAVNLTSWWVNNTLTILTYVGSFPICQNLDMGFGMPVPDWFLFDAEVIPPGLWLTRQYNNPERWYTRTVWTRKSAMPDGYFNYFSDNTTGAPYRMNAPSPAGEVVNEYADFQNVTSFPDGIFGIPPVCSNSSSTTPVLSLRHASTAAHITDALSEHFTMLRFPERAVKQVTSHVVQLAMMGFASQRRRQ